MHTSLLEQDNFMPCTPHRSAHCPSLRLQAAAHRPVRSPVRAAACLNAVAHSTTAAAPARPQLCLAGARQVGAAQVGAATLG